MARYVTNNIQDNIGGFFLRESNADIRRRSGTQSKFLDGGTSNKTPKAGFAKRLEEDKEKEGREVRNGGSACRVTSTP